MPHDKLLAYQIALQLLQEVRDLEVTDPRTRDQLLRASKSICLNIAEAVGRFSNADRKRVYAIARGECCETAAAIDVAGAARECDPERGRVARDTAGRVYGLLTGLIRHYDFEPASPKIGHGRGHEHLHGDVLKNENGDGDVLENGDGHGDGS
ncbi:MAG: four helix bundle protein [Myxococcales bacterium]|nr:four helix bundle protein [Myxococcales bacterium]